MAESQEQPNNEPIEIVRDTTFSRFVADEALITDIGRDVEVGFVQYGPLYTVQTDAGEHEVIESRRVMTEVARMRMSYPAMVNFMMNFFRTGIDDGRLKGEAIIKSLQQWSVDSEKDRSAEGVD